MAWKNRIEAFKKTLLLIGDPAAMQFGIRRIEIERRTILKEELKKYLCATSIKEELAKIKDLDSIVKEELEMLKQIDDLNEELFDEIGAVETNINEDDFK